MTAVIFRTVQLLFGCYSSVSITVFASCFPCSASEFRTSGLNRVRTLDSLDWAAVLTVLLFNRRNRRGRWLLLAPLAAGCCSGGHQDQTHTCPGWYLWSKRGVPSDSAPPPPPQILLRWRWFPTSSSWPDSPTTWLSLRTEAGPDRPAWTLLASVDDDLCARRVN